MLSPVALRWMILGEWRAHPGRIVVASLAIAMGVALGFAVHVVNQSALTEFARAIRTVDGDADLQVHSTSPAGFDEALYPAVARLSGISAVSPVVELTARLGADTPITLLGLDVLRAVRATPSLLGRPASDGPGSQSAPFDPAALFLSSSALTASGRKIGDTIDLAAGGRFARFVIAGTLPGVEGDQLLGVIDIAAAQWRLGQLGRLQRLDLRLAADADREPIVARLRAVLPPDAEIVSRQTEARRSDSLSRAYRVNLEMLAMVALVTGGFLVYSAQSLSVTRRQTQFALLRVLGLRRRALLAQLLLEGGALGLAGALAGIALGFGLADLALLVLGGDLGGGYFSRERPSIVFPPVAALVVLGLGLAVALLGSLLPARDAVRDQPAISLKSPGGAGDPRRTVGGWIGVLLLVAGSLTALAPPLFGLPIFGYLAIALMLAGGVASMPFLARVLLSPLRRLGAGGAAFDLAVLRLWGAPAQAAIALCGIVASTSLMIAMAVMVSSFRGSVEDWLTQALPSDLYLRIENAEAGGFDADLQRRLASADGVAAIRFRKTILLRLDADQPPVALIAEPIDAVEPAQTLPVIAEARSIPPGEVPVWVSEPMMWLYGRHPGDRITIPLGGSARRVFVAGIWRDYARQQGAIVIGADDYSRLTGDALRTEAAIDLAPGASSAAVTSALRALVPPELRGQIDIAEPRQIRAAALMLFDRSFAVTYALEAIAIVLGLTGVAATLSAQTLARTKEFGMLRHIGVLRRQIIAMLALEGALLGAVGIVAGLCLGIAMSQVLIQVVNPQSFHWTMETRLPLPLFASLSVILVAASSGTAIVAGRRALSADAVRAVREDW